VGAEGRGRGIRVEYLTRVEGHGHIVVEVEGGTLKGCRFEVVESPRLFEALLRGRSVFEAQHLTSRICGICACAHSLASLQAAEEALGVEVSEQTRLLRRLLLNVEILDSHVLHVYLLALPDLLGAPSFLALPPGREKAVRRALRMKKACNGISDTLVGRHVHPISCVVGGFTKLPGERVLEEMEESLGALGPDVEATVELVSSLSFPEFARETEYVALVDEGPGYPLIAGDIGSTDGVRTNKGEYRSRITERIVPHSTAKHASLTRDSFAVGALARVNLNGAKLRSDAKQAAADLGLPSPCANPYLNTAAQAVEMVHCREEALAIVRELRERGVDGREKVVVGLNEQGGIPLRAGEGVGAVEAPRGTLYHRYRVDGRGIVEEADCVIPTNQNLANIEADMRELVPTLLHRPEEEIRLALEMLVRAYDPCLSCSTHLVRLRALKEEPPPGEGGRACEPAASPNP